MKYIIMCGGYYPKWENPRWLSKINGESLLEHTINLLVMFGVSHEDIFVSISIDNKLVEEVARKKACGIIYPKEKFIAHDYNKCSGYWCTGFTNLGEPVTYLFGDVYFSSIAIETIINTETDDIEFFASKPPFSEYYIKEWAEPFALKVVDYKHLKKAIDKCIEYADQGKFNRQPIMWELWQVIKGHELNFIDYNSYTAINDCTCDIDSPGDIKKLEAAVGEYIKHS